MQDSSIRLRIVSPESTIFDENVGAVTLPGTKGSFEVLLNHAPLISSLEKGTIVYWQSGEKRSVEIQSGFVDVLHNVVSVCVEV